MVRLLAGSTCALLAWFLAVGCGSEPAPRWIDVAAAAENITSSVEAARHALRDGREVRLSAEGNGLRLELPLTPRDWVIRTKPSVWQARVPLPLPSDDRTNSAVFRLASSTRSFTQQPYHDDESGLVPMAFRVTDEGLTLRLPKHETPDEELTLSYVLPTLGSKPGHVQGPHFSGRGFQVWPGQTLRMTLDVPAGAVLRFATTLDPEDDEANAIEQTTTYRVLQDGEPIFEHVVNDTTRPSQAWHTVALPRSGRSELAFTVHGAFANTCFLDPVLGPEETGSPGRRPWDERRPDIVVFLADTFRADNLRAYGGKPGLTPNLDRLAEESLLFRRAWSVGTFTLPAHVSMFSGVMPMQAGLTSRNSVMPDELETIAELLSAAGYRTGAITCSGYVSRNFGFDQGFEYFHEERSPLETAVERALAFLDADDGRPVFLFLHTYRTHAPYLMSDETRERLGKQLGIKGEFEENQRKLFELVGKDLELPAAAIGTAETTEFLRESRAHYLGGVADLDHGFGEFRRALDERGWFEHGWLLFTSDHGEAFGEHGEITHGETVFEEKIRIPLLIRGKWSPPRVIDLAASLADMAPTLADMAGLAPRPEWSGTSLLTLARDRAVFSFGLGARATVAVIEGSHKVIGHEVGRTVDAQGILGAFDLDRDPGEHAAADPGSWPAEMLRRYAPEFERMFVPLVEARAAELGARDRDELHKLGYDADE